jgi:amidase
MTRSIVDAAIVLSIIAGKDPRDNFTLAQPAKLPDYTSVLSTKALKGARIGVPRKVFLNQTVTGLYDSEIAAFEKALETIRGLGATVVDSDLPSAEEIVESTDETFVLDVDFKVVHFHLVLSNRLLTVTTHSRSNSMRTMRASRRILLVYAHWQI